MDFFKNIAGAMLNAKDFVVEKNRRTALINRLRAVIKCEEQSAERAYIALGRYYYHNLRDASNPITEPNCAEIDAAEKRIEQAVAHLEDFYSENVQGAFSGEEITLDDVEEITPPAADTSALEDAEADAAAEGMIDEAVEPVSTAQNTLEKDPDEELPFEG